MVELDELGGSSLLHRSCWSVIVLFVGIKVRLEFEFLNSAFLVLQYNLMRRITFSLNWTFSKAESGGQQLGVAH